MGKQKLFQQSRTELQFVLLQRSKNDSVSNSFHSDTDGTPIFTPINPSLASSLDNLSKSPKKSLQQLNSEKNKTVPLILELKEGENYIGRNEIAQLQLISNQPLEMFRSASFENVHGLSSKSPSTNEKRKNKLSRQQILINVHSGILYRHATVQLVGANPSVVQRVTESGYLERFYMDKNKIYTIHPGDVVYLLKGMYALRLEERQLPVVEPPAPAEPVKIPEVAPPNSPERSPLDPRTAAARLEAEKLRVQEITLGQRSPMSSGSRRSSFSSEDVKWSESEDESKPIDSDVIEGSGAEEHAKVYKMLRKQVKREKKQMEELNKELIEVAHEMDKLKETLPEPQQETKKPSEEMESFILSYSSSGTPLFTRKNRGRSFGTATAPPSITKNKALHSRNSGELILPQDYPMTPPIPLLESKDKFYLGQRQGTGSLPSSPSTKGNIRATSPTPSKKKGLQRQRSFTALQPLGTATLTKEKHREMEVNAVTKSYFIPLLPGFRLEVEKVVEFQMTSGVKQQLQKSMQMYPVRRVESYVDKRHLRKVPSDLKRSTEVLPGLENK